MQKNILAQVTRISEPLCISEGVELVHIEFQHESGGTVLRFYIDKPGGVTLDNCVAISRQINDIIDINININIPYRLEVSSPGSNRPLSKMDDFQKFKGETARIKTAQPLDGQKNFTGMLIGVNQENVELMVNDKIVTIPYQDITKARLVNYNGDHGC